MLLAYKWWVSLGKMINRCQSHFKDMFSLFPGESQDSKVLWKGQRLPRGPCSWLREGCNMCSPPTLPSFLQVYEIRSWLFCSDNLWKGVRLAKNFCYYTEGKGSKVIKHVLDQTVTFCCTHLKHSGGNIVLLWRMTRDMNHDISSIFA